MLGSLLTTLVCKRKMGPRQHACKLVQLKSAKLDQTRDCLLSIWYCHYHAQRVVAEGRKSYVVKYHECKRTVEGIHG